MASLTRGKFCEIRPVGREATDALLGVYRACENFLGLGPQSKADRSMVLRDLDGSRKFGGVFCSIHDRTGGMIGVVDFMPRGFEGQPEVAFVSLLMVQRFLVCRRTSAAPLDR
jgi:hypothetical protein